MVQDRPSCRASPGEPGKWLPLGNKAAVDRLDNGLLIEIARPGVGPERL